MNNETSKGLKNQAEDVVIILGVKSSRVIAFLYIITAKIIGSRDESS